MYKGKILVKENNNLARRIRLRMMVTISHFHLASIAKRQHTWRSIASGGLMLSIAIVNN